MCVLRDAFDFESPSEIANLIMDENLEAALALHLYRGGRLLQGTPLMLPKSHGGVGGGSWGSAEKNARCYPRTD